MFENNEMDPIPRCVIFTSSTHTTICSLSQDLLKIRLQKNIQKLQQMFVLNISSKQFPDYLRHTPYDSTTKLFQYIQKNKENSLKFVDGKIGFRIDQVDIGVISVDKYVKVQSQIEEVLELKEAESNIIQLPRHEYKPKFQWDWSTIHAMQYTQIGSTLQKLMPGWTQITTKQKIGMKQQFQIKIRYQRYGNALSIGAGFLTKSRKNYHYSGDQDHVESVAYWSRQGYKRGCIVSHGKKVVDWNCLLYNSEGDTLSITFKPEIMMVFWDNGRKVAQTKLEDAFINKQIYFFVVMHDFGSAIRFIK